MKIAYITERDINSKQISGAITRDIRLLEILKTFSEVDIYFNNPSKYHKYLYVVNNKNVNSSLFDEIDNKKYDVVIISTFVISPFLQGYKSIKSKKIFYLADSAFHMRTQNQSIKYKALSYVLSFKEKNILKDSACAYLGSDEIMLIPKKYHKNCITFPFFINASDNLFKNDGKLILVGDFSFKPNLLMLLNINNIAEKIENDIYVYGKNIPKLDYKSNIKIIGYAETLEEIYKNSRALLYPLDYGTGIKNKVLEAMSYGIPTIGFKEAFTNLSLKDSETCVMATTMEDFIEKTNLRDLSEISKSLHKYTNDTFNFVRIQRIIKNELEEIVNDKKNI